MERSLPGAQPVSLRHLPPWFTPGPIVFPPPTPLCTPKPALLFITWTWWVSPHLPRSLSQSGMYPPVPGPAAPSCPAGASQSPSAVAPLLRLPGCRWFPWGRFQQPREGRWLCPFHPACFTAGGTRPPLSPCWVPLWPCSLRPPAACRSRPGRVRTPVTGGSEAPRPHRQPLLQRCLASAPRLPHQSWGFFPHPVTPWL